jgi:hypothetical protein
MTQDKREWLLGCLLLLASLVAALALSLGLDVHSLCTARVEHGETTSETSGIGALRVEYDGHQTGD